ncbi:MAG: hypothetical protein GY705_10140 [Bacteroidetes bacterium]|nr:hypothetical protein [Bacteroidota bacterium]
MYPVFFLQFDSINTDLDTLFPFSRKSGRYKVAGDNPVPSARNRDNGRTARVGVVTNTLQSDHCFKQTGITTIDFQVSRDSEVLSTASWNGNLDFGNQDSVGIDGIDLVTGLNEFVVEIVTGDEGESNTIHVSYSNYAKSGFRQNVYLSESFGSYIYPPGSS